MPGTALGAHPWYNRRALKHKIRIAVAIVLTVFFIALFLWNTNLHDVGRIFGSASLLWIGGGMLVNIAALAFRTFRWRVLLDPDEPPRFYPTFFANTVGYMLSTVLPIRAGDFARPALLARRTKISFSSALGTVLTERVLDLTSILVLLLWFAVAEWNHFGHDPAMASWFFVIKSGAITAAAMLVALYAFMLCLYVSSGTVRRLHEWLGHFLPHRFRDPWMNFFDAFVGTLDITHHPGAFIRVIVYTAGIWICLTSQFWFVAHAIRRPLPFDASFFVTAVTTVALAVPTPGGVGSFDAACKKVLTDMYHFDSNTAVAVALLFHIVGALPVIVVGVSLFFREGLKWGQVSAAVEEEER